MGPDVVNADSFEAALARAIPGLNVDLQSETVKPEADVTAPEDDESSESPEPQEDESDELSVEELLALSGEAFDRADAALRAGDLAGYQRWVEEAAGYISKAQKLLSESPARDDADAA